MSTPQPVGVGPDGGRDTPIPLPAPLLRELVEALRTIRYGTIELVIHDGRVVQLERREKVRFEPGGTEHTR
jgi:hypothetical protein